MTTAYACERCCLALSPLAGECPVCGGMPRSMPGDLTVRYTVGCAVYFVIAGLHFESGDFVTGDARVIPGDAVRVVTADGRTAFEVRVSKSGDAIEVRSVQSFRANGVVMDNAIHIRPRSANSIEVFALPYKE